MIINNKNRVLGFGFVLVSWLLVACGSPQNGSGTTPNRPTLYKQSYFVFGTVLDVLTWVPEQQKPLLEKALLDVEDKLNAMHRQWHAWKPGRLQAINAALRRGQGVVVSEEEARFLQRVKNLSEASQGAFDPAIGELVHLWGFHTDEFPLHSPPPEDATIKRWLQNRPSMADLVLEKDGTVWRVRSTNAKIWLDLGGVAKGYATDVVAEILRQAGFDDVIINAGGDVLVRGQKGGKPWRVAIRAPGQNWPGDILAVIESRGNEAVFTSGNYQRYTRFDGTRYAHILDPATGWPVPDVVSATVITTDGTLADAAATAMIVAGWQKWPAVAENLGVDSVLLLGEDGRCEMTPAMAQRLKKSTLSCRTRMIDRKSRHPSLNALATEKPASHTRPSPSSSGKPEEGPHEPGGKSP